MNVSRLSFALGLTLALAACATTKKAEVEPDINEKKILEAIHKSSVVIADAIRITAESENAMRSMSMTEEQKESYQEAMAYTPPNMERQIPMFLRNQELEIAAKQLALMTDYDFNVVNPNMRPRDGVLITIQTPGRSGADIARDMGTQAGVRADLNIHPYSFANRKSSKFGLIEIVYK
jgi:hypothetical protein